MNGLSSVAIELVRVGRAGLRPSLNDRARVSAALSARLCSAWPPSSDPAPETVSYAESATKLKTPKR